MSLPPDTIYPKNTHVSCMKKISTDGQISRTTLIFEEDNDGPSLVTLILRLENAL